ncbi:MAG: hypothetical protein M3142_05300 [Bacteroidota bacterium]|nr:hypothetical protein [Bacteroidota bacterium]
MSKTFTHLVLISLFLLLTNQNSFGQKNFVQGYLILPSQDSITGLINNQEWDHNPERIEFKENQDSSIKVFTFKQLIGFGFNSGDVYRKAVVQVDKTPVRFEELLNRSKPKIVTDTIFLLEQVKGTVSLYHLLDENDKNHFYIQKNTEPLAELIQRNYVTYQNNQPFYGTSNQYHDQLKYSYLTDCPNIQSKIVKTSYTKAALSSLIKKYNACFNPELQVTSTVVSKHENKFALVAGVNITTYNFTSENYEYLTKAQFSWQKNPTLGLSHQLILPRNRKKFSIYNELSWKRNYTQGQFNIKDSYYTSQGMITIKANYIGVTSMFRYSWMNPKCQPFFNFGLAGNYATAITTRVQAQEQHSKTEENTNKLILENPGKFEGAAVAGVGIKLKNMATEVRIEKGMGYLNPYSEISNSKTMLSFLMTYFFN